mgnify:CR=1 FL=1
MNAQQTLKQLFAYRQRLLQSQIMSAQKFHVEVEVKVADQLRKKFTDEIKSTGYQISSIEKKIQDLHTKNTRDSHLES